MHGKEIPYLGLERRRDAPSKRLHGRRQHGPGRAVELVDLLGSQRRPLPKRAQAGGVKDLVAVGVADPGRKALIAE